MTTNKQEDDEICCLETLVQDMFLDQFQQVQLVIIQSYPTPMPTSLVEMLLQPLVGDNEAASAHGKSLLLMGGSSSKRESNDPDISSASKDTQIQEDLLAKQKQIMTAVTALSSPTILSQIKQKQFKNEPQMHGKLSATNTATIQEEISFHSSSQFSRHASVSAMYTTISNHPLPLHIAAEFGCSIHLIKSLMETYPDGARHIYMPCAVVSATTAVEQDSQQPSDSFSLGKIQLTDYTNINCADFNGNRSNDESDDQKNVAVALKGPALFPIDCLERGRAGLFYLYSAEKLKERNKKGDGRHSELTSTTKHEDPSFMKELERTFKEFAVIHDSLFAFYPDVPSSPRIRVSSKPQYVQTHDVEVLGDLPTGVNGTRGHSYSNFLLRQLAEHFTVDYTPPTKRSMANGNRSLFSMVSPAQLRTRDKQRISQHLRGLR